MDVRVLWSCNIWYRSGFRVSPTHFILDKHISGPSLIPRLMSWTKSWGRIRMLTGEARGQIQQPHMLDSCQPHCTSGCHWQCLLPSLASLRHGAWPSSNLSSMVLTLLVKVKSHKAAFCDVSSSECAWVGRNQLMSSIKAELSANCMLDSWALGSASEVLPWAVVISCWRFSLSGSTRTLFVTTHLCRTFSGQTQLYLQSPHSYCSSWSHQSSSLSSKIANQSYQCLSEIQFI